MKFRIVSCLLAIGLAGTAGGALAAAVAGAAGTPPQRQGAVLAAPVQPATAVTVTWVTGVIEAVDAGQRTLTLRGKPVALDAARLQVLDGAGQGGSLASLRAGQQIRFALEPGDAPGRKIVLIQIDRQP